MQTILDDKFLKSIEDHARIIASGAGRILINHFDKRLQIKYKDTARTDPVTNADIESENFLIKSISERFPEHGIISEEGISDDTVAEDLIWILDPLDGTRNFMSGLPVYACSVGVLYKGSPIVGAVFMPWPNDRGSIVLHARRGGIAYKDEAPIHQNRNTPSHIPNIVGLPANFDTAYKFRVIPRKTSWEPRVTGSIAFELGLIALGVLPYSLFISPKLWDVAAGLAIIEGSGGKYRIKELKNKYTLKVHATNNKLSILK